MSDDAPVIIAAALGGAGLLWLAHSATADREPAQPIARSPRPDARRTTESSSPPTKPAAPEHPPTPAASPSSPPSTTTSTTDTDAPAGLWLWPVPIIDGHRPIVSDGWGSPRDGGARRHAGVDLMFWRRTPTELITVYKPGTPNAEGRYFMRDDAIAIAAAAGRVWSAFSTPRGHQVLLDHGRFATLYQHLERLMIDERHAGPGGPLVEAGHPLGVIGGDPLNAPHLKHLHFELWRGGKQIDPEPFLRSWQLVEIRTQATGTIDVALEGEAHTTRA